MPNQQNQVYGTGNEYLSLATLASATSGSGTQNTRDIINPNGRGLVLGMNVTALADTSVTITATVQGKDEASGQYYTLGSTGAVATTGLKTLILYPGMTDATDSIVNRVLPNTWRVSITVAAGSSSGTVSAVLGASLQV